MTVLNLDLLLTVPQNEIIEDLNHVFMKLLDDFQAYIKYKPYTSNIEVKILRGEKVELHVLFLHLNPLNMNL